MSTRDQRQAGDYETAMSLAHIAIASLDDLAVGASLFLVQHLSGEPIEIPTLFKWTQAVARALADVERLKSALPYEFPIAWTHHARAADTTVAEVARCAVRTPPSLFWYVADDGTPRE